MNILMFCSNPVSGGTVRIFCELAKELPKVVSEGDHVACCVNKDNPSERYKDIKDLETIPVVSENQMFKDYYGGGLLRRTRNWIIRRVSYRKTLKQNISVMVQYIRNGKFDCIIIHNGGYVGDDLCNQMLEASYRCAEHTLHRIYVLHSDSEKSICSKLRFRHYDKTISKQATNIVTVSNFTKNRIESSSFVTKDLDVIYNGVSDERGILDEGIKARMLRNADKMHIIMIGNFHYYKGALSYIHMACDTLKERADVDFCIIGNIYEEDYYNKCMETIRTAGCEDIISVYQGIHNAADYIDLFDIMVVPSLYDESFGLISVEAMMRSVPVVAYACGGIPEVVVDSETGFIVPTGDEEELKEKVGYLLDHPDVKKNMGEKGRMRYEEHFTSREMARNYYSLIKQEALPKQEIFTS